MAANRDALARRAKISLGGDSVLLIAQLVGAVGQRFHQGDAQIGGLRSFHAGIEHRHAIEHQAAKARIVFGQIVDFGRRAPARAGRDDAVRSRRDSGIRL